MLITDTPDKWTVSEYNKQYQFRVDLFRGRLYRKETSSAYFGGYQIKYCGIDSRLAKEWIEGNFDTMGLEY